MLAFLMFVGCAGTRFTWDQARQLKTGMTKPQVLAVMGEPYLKTYSAGNEKWIWSHSDFLGDTKAVSILFADDTVTSVPPIPR